MPSALSPDQLARSMSGAAEESSSFRHQGPLGDLRQNLPVQSTSSNSGFSASTPWGTHPQLTQQPGQSGREQENIHYYLTQDGSVPVYQKQCSKCTWSSIASTDPGAYLGAVADLELHIKETHGEVKNNSNSPSEEYTIATRLRDVPATQDDALNNLSVVRYWSMPLSWRNSQLNLPRVQTPLCTVGDYEPYGLEANNRPLLKDLHDRTNKKLKLKHFSDPNLKLIPSQQQNLIAFEKGNTGNLMTTKEWKELTNEREAIKASHNYMELCRAIHPLDSGPQILYKVMLEKFLSGGTTAAQLEDFFASVTWELANRAAKSEVPYKHAELLLKWDQMYRNTYHAYGQPSLEKTVEDIMKRTMPPYSPIQKKKQKPPHSWCIDFNKPQGCSNTVDGSGCVDKSGKSLKHGCNMRNKDNKTCNSPDHNRFKHIG